MVLESSIPLWHSGFHEKAISHNCRFELEEPSGWNAYLLLARAVGWVTSRVFWHVHATCIPVWQGDRTQHLALLLKKKEDESHGTSICLVLYVALQNWVLKQAVRENCSSDKRRVREDISSSTCISGFFFPWRPLCCTGGGHADGFGGRCSVLCRGTLIVVTVVFSYTFLCCTFISCVKMCSFLW